MRTLHAFPALVAGAAMVAAAPALAETLRLAVKDMTTVQDGLGNSRVFFHLTDPGSLGDVAVSSASVQFELAGTTRAGSLDLAVHPVQTAWSPGAVTWSTAFDESVYGRTEVDLNRGGTVSLDVTLVVKEMLEGGVATNGFVLTAAAPDALGLQAADVSRFSNLASGAVEINYRTTPPRPRPR
ncbi:MAG: DNRLRE domain-containing protein [Candidatus Eiseniibacteriota bacterium]